MPKRPDHEALDIHTEVDELMRGFDETDHNDNCDPDDRVRDCWDYTHSPVGERIEDAEYFTGSLSPNRSARSLHGAGRAF